MMRFAPALSAALALTACTSHRVSLEGLRPRAAEAIDPRVPLPTEPVAGPVDQSLSGRIAAAEAQARQGAAAFDALLPAARAAASAAGSKGSESWIAAQEQLSALVGARAPVSTALADIDAMGGKRIEGAGDIGVADRKILDEASARVAAIDAAEQDAISALSAQIAR